MDNGWSIAAFLLKIWRFIFPSKKQQTQNQTQTQKSGDKSNNLQAGRDINIKGTHKDVK